MERSSIFLVVITAAIGALVLFGWWVGLRELTTIFPGLSPMQANTAMGLVLSGLALVLLADTNRGHRWQWFGRLCAVVVVFLGTASGIEHLSGIDLGIDRLLVQDPGSGSGSPGRMAPSTAACFSMLGLAVVTLDARSRWLRNIASGGVLVVGVIALTTLLAYVLSTASHGGFESYTEMALHTAIAFVLMAAAALFSRPKLDIMMRVTSDTMGGALIRRGMPIAIVVPAVVGWIRLMGQTLGLYGVEVGLSLTTLSMACSVGALIWVVASTIDRAEILRRHGDDMAQLAEHDALSGLFNRRHLDRVLTDECRRAVRYGRQLSTVMIDIDEFGQTNKLLGHQAGDSLLREVAQIIHGVARETDIACRYGGDEFFLVLPETGFAGAAALGERLRKAVSEKRLGATLLGDPITISVGVFAPAEVSDIDPDALVRNVDAALRQAKVRGKNLMVAARRAVLHRAPVTAAAEQR